MEKLLATVIQLKASDLHISVGQPPVIRHHGRMRKLEAKTLDNDDTTGLMKSIAPDRCQQEFTETGSADFGFAFGDQARVRVSIFRQKGNDKAAFVSSALYITIMLVGAVFALYPTVLPASTNPAWSLTIHNASAPTYGLTIGLVWWSIGMVFTPTFLPGLSASVDFYNINLHNAIGSVTGTNTQVQALCRPFP